VVRTGAGSVDGTIWAYCVRLIENHNTLYPTQVKHKNSGYSSRSNAQPGCGPSSSNWKRAGGERSLHCMRRS